MEIKHGRYIFGEAKMLEKRTNNVKKLPIIYENQLNGECWTFYKFAILNSSLIAKPWLATHIEFYINENMCGGYGDPDGDYYRMRYYSDILSFERISASDTTPEKIVRVIHDEIEKDRYVILYLNFNRLYGAEGVSLHELLVYGFDDNRKICYCPFLINGKFKEVEIPFDLIQEGYEEARNLYLDNGWRLLVKRSYYFGITSLKIRDDYLNDNWVADYIDKIDHEIHGNRIVKMDLSVDKPVEHTIYTGNACLIGLSIYLEKVSAEGSISDTVSWRLVRTLKMMYDYRQLFISSMEWFVDIVNGNDNKTLLTIINEYMLCAKCIQYCYLMFCKYIQTKNVHLIEKIKNILDELQLKEKSILIDYRELIWPYYYKMNGVPMPSEDE